MDPTLFGALAVLALVDSTSFGTLLIPVWLLLAPGRLRPGRILLFLGTVAVFYFGVGLAILFGAELVVENFSGLYESRGFSVFLLAAGIALLAWSFRLEAQAKREKAARGSVQHTGHGASGTGRTGTEGTGTGAAGTAGMDEAAGTDLAESSAGAPASGRLARWRHKAVGSETRGSGGAAALIGLALGATTIELATMVPYLAAIGLLSASGLQWPLTGAVLAAYCVLMVAPALVLLIARFAASRRVDPMLKKLDGFLSRTSTNTLSWITGILGVLLIVNTAGSVLNFGG